MILEFLPHRACDSILPTLISVSLLALLRAPPLRKLLQGAQGDLYCFTSLCM